jgi:type IV secretion system protein VirB5
MKNTMKKAIFINFALMLSTNNANAMSVFDAANFGQMVQSVQNGLNQVQQGAQELVGQANQLIELKTQVMNQVQQIQQLKDQLLNMSNISGIGDLANINGTISNFAALPQKLNTTTNNVITTAGQLLTQQQQATVSNIAALQSVYDTAVTRNTDLQTLLNQVEQSPSAKNIADLSARIQAEQIFLQNEANQIAVWGQAQQAQKDKMQLAQIAQKIEARHAGGAKPTNW